MISPKTHEEANGSVPPGRPLGDGTKPEKQPDLGPTGPAAVEGEKPGPQSGGYDRQSPDHSTDNARGGYGAG